MDISISKARERALGAANRVMANFENSNMNGHDLAVANNTINYVVNELIAEFMESEAA